MSIAESPAEVEAIVAPVTAPDGRVAEEIRGGTAADCRRVVGGRQTDMDNSDRQHNQSGPGFVGWTTVHRKQGW
ncbi:MAG: hypothetical protein PHE68_03575 [Candidatus Peribacteraceae bacterium]|nr:hypothetical protein [Candidatus Peribacteraceae bacterium]MDD5074699.1 hypothetical protein [Candidatus Peribacteraceae bacterium]